MAVSGRTTQLAHSGGAGRARETEMATITGTDGQDTIVMTAGVDVVTALGGDDTILGGANLTRQDRIDGGEGFDRLTLDGDYAAQLVFSANTLTNVEAITLEGGHDYSLRLSDATASGPYFYVDATQAGSLTLDARAETDAMLSVKGSTGNDVLYGGAAGDSFDLTNGGEDRVIGGAGSDFIDIGRMSAGDRIDGGGGADLARMAADVDVTLTGANFRNVEELVLWDVDGAHAVIKTTDSMLAAGQTLRVGITNDSGSDQSIDFDGSAETNGAFSIRGGSGDDVIRTGAGNDTIEAVGFSDDKIFAGAGDDDIYMGSGLSLGDLIDGGEGRDRVVIDGSVNDAPILLRHANIRNVEVIALDHNAPIQRLIASDDLLATGETIHIFGGYLDDPAQRFTFDGSAETDGAYTVQDGAGNDTIRTGGGADDIDMRNGGLDVVSTGGGDDLIRMFDKLTALDQIDGGAGHDTISLDGDYSSGVAFFPGTIRNIESISMYGGHDYKLKLADANIASGETLEFAAYHLERDDFVAIDARAETDGAIHVRMGESFLDAGTYVRAGSGGDDRVSIEGDYSGGLTFRADQLTGVEQLDVFGAHSYRLATNDANVAAGEQLLVNGLYVEAGHSLHFDGSAETDGSFRVLGGYGHDTLIGGANADRFELGHGGRDSVSAGAGDDMIYVDGAFDVRDTIDGGAGFDTLSLIHTPSVRLTGAVTGVEQLHLWDGPAEVTVTDGFLGGGARLIVDATYLTAGNGLAFDGSAETDAWFHVKSGAGDDAIRGGALDDLLIGGNGADQLWGGGGDDILMGGLGGDRLAGGAGVDTVTYVNARSGAQVSLAEGVGYGDGESGGDVFVSIENVVGSSRGDTIVGSAGSNRIDGGSGDDYIEGGAGADTMFGGSGSNDWLSYAGATSGVQVSLATGRGSSGDALGDVFTGFEKLVGSAHADTLYGDGVGNVINGGDGGDWINGGGGDDRLTGGAGSDTLVGGSGFDVFVFEAGDGPDAILDFNASYDKLQIFGEDGPAALDDVEISYTADKTFLDYDGGSIVMNGHVQLSDWNFIA